MEKPSPLACVILAAGKGTRMKSDLPKVLHALAGKPMLRHVVGTAEQIGASQIVVVVGPGMDAVAQAAAPHKTALQKEQKGTGDAVRAGWGAVEAKGGDVLVLYADVPGIGVETAQRLIDRHHQADRPQMTVLGMRPPMPDGYGRLITDTAGYVMRIVEQLDATPEERAVTLCNSGMMVMTADVLTRHLPQLKNDNAKGEYYLTDLIGLVNAAGGKCAVVEGSYDDLEGVNDRAQLAQAEARMQKKLRDAAMKNGVTMTDPNTVYLCADTKIANDVTIEPNVFMGPEVVIESGVTIKAFCHLESVTIKSGAQIGPFARIRPGSEIGADARIGNFVEVKASKVGAGTKAGHLSYIGDTVIGAETNIGAGTIICNYDGFDKHKTHIGDHVFVGSNSTLVAPLKINDGAFVAAASVVTRDVAADALAIARPNQDLKEGWAARYRAAKTKKKAANA